MEKSSLGKYGVGDILEIKATEHSPPFHLLVLQLYGYSVAFEEHTVIYLEDGVTLNARFYDTDKYLIKVVA